MKGISAVIATLLLLVITIGLAATAYFYINNIVQRSIAKVVTVGEHFCSTSGTSRVITLVITNTGTENIEFGDIKYTLNNAPVQNLGNQQQYPLPPRGSTVFTISGAASGSNTLLIIAPSGSIKLPIIC